MGKTNQGSRDYGQCEQPCRCWQLIRTVWAIKRPCRKDDQNVKCQITRRTSLIITGFPWTLVSIHIWNVAAVATVQFALEYVIFVVKSWYLWCGCSKYTCLKLEYTKMWYIDQIIFINTFLLIFVLQHTFPPTLKNVLFTASAQLEPSLPVEQLLHTGLPQATRVSCFNCKTRTECPCSSSLIWKHHFITQSKKLLCIQVVALSSDSITGL